MAGTSAVSSKSGSCECSRSVALRAVVVFLFLIALPILVLFSSDVLHALLSLLTAIKRLGHVRGAIALSIANIVGALLFAPCLPFTLGAGYIYGLPVGTLIVTGSSLVAAVAAFLAARYVLRSSVEAHLANAAPDNKWRIIDGAVHDDGFRIVFLIRLSPLHPWALCNYLFGLTAVTFTDYTAATFLSTVPTTIMEVYFGTAMSDLNAILSGDSSQSMATRIFFWTGLALTIGVSVALTLWVRRALRNELDKYQKRDATAAHYRRVALHDTDALTDDSDDTNDEDMGATPTINDLNESRPLKPTSQPSALMLASTAPAALNNLFHSDALKQHMQFAMSSLPSNQIQHHQTNGRATSASAAVSSRFDND